MRMVNGKSYVFVFSVILYDERKLGSFRELIKKSAPEIVYESVEVKGGKLYFNFVFRVRGRVVQMPTISGYGRLVENLFRRVGIHLRFVEGQERKVVEKILEPVSEKIVDAVKSATKGIGEVVGSLVSGILKPLKEYIVVVVVVVVIVLIIYFSLKK